MIEKPYWTKAQISIFEFCFDEIKQFTLATINFQYLLDKGYTEQELKSNFIDDENLIIELVRYWAWKETWDFSRVLIKIENPFKRLFALMRWGFKNNRYIKLYLYLLRMQLPEEARKEIEKVNQHKQYMLTKMFMDRGIPEEQASIRAQSILPFYYGWAQEKDDHVKSDLQIIDVLSIYKTLLFPELFKDKKVTVKDLREETV